MHVCINCNKIIVVCILHVMSASNQQLVKEDTLIVFFAVNRTMSLNQTDANH